MDSFSSGLNCTWTHRLAMVTKALGTDSPVMMITVVSGGSSRVLE